VLTVTPTLKRLTLRTRPDDHCGNILSPKLVSAGGRSFAATLPHFVAWCQRSKTKEHFVPPIIAPFYITVTLPALTALLRLVPMTSCSSVQTMLSSATASWYVFSHFQLAYSLCDSISSYWQHRRSCLNFAPDSYVTIKETIVVYCE
jgi:hypothetical protein